MSDLPSGKRVLSGIQASGTFHLGNYFGAARQHVALQETNDVRIFIADYHSMNAVRDAVLRREHTRALALDYLALGLDPERAIFYRQSDLPEVQELAWILATVTPLGLLERAHAYKDAVARGEPVDAGVFNYPVLMAADILIHDADLVPVGQDQKQHIEIARDIAAKLNHAYGPVLTLPEPYIQGEVAVVPGTDGRKMSKSYRNTIEVFAPEKALRGQIMGIITDSMPVDAPKDPALPLFQLLGLFLTTSEREALRERCARGGLGYGDAKKELLARLLERFGEARARRERLAGDLDRVEDVLRAGARRARESVAPLMERVRAATGIGPLR
jgi:tryptophanyl-tRNA synthetase